MQQNNNTILYNYILYNIKLYIYIYSIKVQLDFKMRIKRKLKEKKILNQFLSLRFL